MDQRSAILIHNRGPISVVQHNPAINVHYF